VICLRDRAGAFVMGITLLVFYMVVVLFFWNRFRTRMSKRPHWNLPGWNEPPEWSAFTGDRRVTDVIRDLERPRRFALFGSPHMWTWQSFVEELSSRNIERPRTIIDEAALAQLGSVPLPNHMLEP
jgi:hypothetical protein